MFRKSGVVKLPSQRKLNDYTFYTKATCGFSDGVNQQLMETAKLDTCEEKDKYIFLITDEMQICLGNWHMTLYERLFFD